MKKASRQLLSALLPVVLANLVFISISYGSGSAMTLSPAVSDKTLTWKSNESDTRSMVFENTILSVQVNPGLPLAAVFLANPESVKIFHNNTGALLHTKNKYLLVKEVVIINLATGKQLLRSLVKGWLGEVWSKDGSYAVIHTDRWYGPFVLVSHKLLNASNKQKKIYMSSYVTPPSCTAAGVTESIGWHRGNDNTYIVKLTVCGVFHLYHVDLKTRISRLVDKARCRGDRFCGPRPRMLDSSF
jgi:hypothetical protein